MEHVDDETLAMLAVSDQVAADDVAEHLASCDRCRDEVAALQRVAAVNGLPEAAVVTFPTALIVSVPQHDTVRTAVSTAGSRVLRLDQVADVLDLAHAASRGEVRPREGLQALSAIVLSETESSNGESPWISTAGPKRLLVTSNRRSRRRSSSGTK